MGNRCNVNVVGCDENFAGRIKAKWRKKSAVIGAVLQLSYCCDFLDSEYIDTLMHYYSIMETLYGNAVQSLPKNK